MTEHFALVAMHPPNVGMSFQKPTRGIDVRGRMIKSTWSEPRRCRETKRNGEYPINESVRVQTHADEVRGGRISLQLLPLFALADGTVRTGGAVAVCRAYRTQKHRVSMPRGRFRSGSKKNLLSHRSCALKKEDLHTSANASVTTGRLAGPLQT